jgi:hypothetical protein
MQYVLLFLEPRHEPAGEKIDIAEMARFAAEVRARGLARGGAPLQPESAGARVTMRDGKPLVVDGPFAETKEVAAGFFVVEAESRAAAVEIAKQCPFARWGTVEVRQSPDRDVVAGAASGTRFLFLLHMSPDLKDDDGSCYRAMVAYDDVLKSEGSYVESSQLALEPFGARVRVRHGKTLVTDGPFTETKEVAGGYYIVRAATRADAIEIAKRCPHAREGTIEVRELALVG